MNPIGVSLSAASLEYISIASSFASEDLTELAKHFYRQAGEERDHAMRFVKYVVDAGGKMAIPTIPAISLLLTWMMEG